MAIIKSFAAYRPQQGLEKAVASRPYDVLNSSEARVEVEGNPHSFLHVVKPEIDFPAGFNVYDDAVYEKGRQNFLDLITQGTFTQDDQSSLYIYRLEMDGLYQTGLVALASVDDYLQGIIKKHELTRPDKEEDRKKHVRVGGIHAEPVFFAYPEVNEIDTLVDDFVQKTAPVYDFVADDGIGHTLWQVNDPSTVQNLVDLFAQKVPYTYVADGHHRTAAAALVGEEFRKANSEHTGEESYNYFMAVHFPANQLRIIDYNRVVKDLNGHSDAAFLQGLAKSFEVVEKGTDTYKPSKLHEMSMYLSGTWYSLMAKSATYDDNDPIGVLDVTILSNEVLGPLLNIVDLRTDKRIEFVGGIRGLGELKKRVDSGEMQVAFALYPVSMQQLIDISDTDNIMPPKTTWFEPKLRSGLFVHKFA